MLTASKRTAAIAFAALLVGTIVLVAATAGLGKPSLPDGAVAFVEDAPEGEVTQEQFDAALVQAAARQATQTGAEPTVPEAGTPQYDLLKETAMADLLLARWVRGEATELGIEVADREIDTELEKIVEEQFGGQKEFDKFLEQSSFTPDDARDRVELQLLSSRIQEDILGTEPPAVSDEEIQSFYDENIEQFETPETRDVRTVLNPDEAKAQEALDQLSEDDSPGSWKRVTQELSTDEATAPLGGLRQGVVAGQNEPALDDAIFSGEEGELVGPIEGEAGFYVVQVSTINPAETQPLDDQVSQQISQTLGAERQQELATAYQESFLEKWRTRTVCSEEATIDRCSNAPALPDACQGDDEGEEPAVDPATGEPSEGCPAFVPSTRPAPPSSAGDDAAAGLPQGPQFPAPPAPTALPPGAQPIPGGAAPGQPAPPPPVPGANPQLAASGADAAVAALARLDEITRRLRVECPWDREQDERTIVPHTVEEAYELADAAASGDDAKLLDELGDVLFQVHFLALLMEERGAGSLTEVAEGMTQKLIRRHPHVFEESEARELLAGADPKTSGQVLANWDKIKREVEGRGAGDPFADVPENLPGLLYARKMLRRSEAEGEARRRSPGVVEPGVSDPEGGAPVAKDVAQRDKAEAWVGDLLLEIVAISRRLGVDPELALRAAARRLREQHRG